MSYATNLAVEATLKTRLTKLEYKAMGFTGFRIRLWLSDQILQYI